MSNAIGYVRAILSRSPTHAAASFVVELYSPGAKPGQRTKRYDLDKVGDNRELVMVSVLRDALIHSLPVCLGFDKSQKISDVELFAAAPYDDWPTDSITGYITMISIDEGGLGTTTAPQPDLATVFLTTHDGVKQKLYLNLQEARPITKATQLDLLRHAYHAGDTQVTVAYQTRPVSPGKVARLIVGVQLGSSGVVTPP